MDLRNKFQPKVPFEIFHQSVIYGNAKHPGIYQATEQIQDFDAGAIGAMYVPLCEAAYDWMGISKRYKGNASTNIIRLHAIGDSMIRKPNWRDDSSRDSVDCGGFVVQKLTACLRALRYGDTFCSDELPDGMTIEGQYNGPGAIGYAIMAFDPQTGELLSDLPWAYIIYGVSGATGAEDKWCAYASWLPLITCLGVSNCQHVLHTTQYDPHIAVMHGEILFKPEYADKNRYLSRTVSHNDNPEPCVPENNGRQPTDGFDHVDSICTC